jgi:hypothetical protein
LSGSHKPHNREARHEQDKYRAVKETWICVKETWICVKEIWIISTRVSDQEPRVGDPQRSHRDLRETGAVNAAQTSHTTNV